MINFFNNKEGELKEPKSVSELETEARESSKKSLDEYFDFINELERKDYFAIFLNVMVAEFDQS